MKRQGIIQRLPRDQVRQGLALAVLLILAALAIAGPTGLLAWNEEAGLLQQRKTQIAKLTDRRNELRNLVDGLDPEAADPDLVGELLRKNMNVVHPDEVVITVEGD